ncbi:MAG TPA: transposase, partial [Isosphaeraceae bacterium]|nr:transposase [Isosphaeraceae bacterium]
ADCSRQTISDHARKVQAALEDAHDGGPTRAPLIERNQSLCQENAQLWGRLAQSLEFPPSQQRECSVTAAAMGLSLNQIIGLLALILGDQACPGRSTLHRWIQPFGVVRMNLLSCRQIRSYRFSAEAAAMILGDVFERFAQDSPLSVMAQGILENALNPQILDQLFDDVAEKPFTNKLLFSTIVDLMSVVVCRIRPSIHAAFQARAETVGATIDAVYDKLDGTETVVSAALVHAVAARLAPVIDARNGARPDGLPGSRVRILDGNHLPGSEHRRKELRTIRAGALPGPALVVLDPRLMWATDVVRCEDGPAQERSLLDQVLAIIATQDLGIADRNFGTTDFLFGIAQRDGFFVIRQHAATLHGEFVGKRRPCGRIDTGKVFEPTIRATSDAGEILILRRVTVLLDQPTRDGETELHLLTNVPAQDARAQVIADLDRRRGTSETAFQEWEATLQGEVNTRGDPKAALFAFCVALVAYNVLSTVKAALRSVHGAEKVAEEVSGYYVADEVQMTHRGMMIAIPEDEWVVFHDLSPGELADVLVGLARSVSLPKLRKHPRGPKKPKPKKQSGAKIKHVATAKILKARQACTK